MESVAVVTGAERYVGSEAEDAELLVLRHKR